MNPALLLLSVGLFFSALYVLSGAILNWIDRNPLKLAVGILAVGALFVFIRFAPGALAAMRAAACGCQ